MTTLWIDGRRVGSCDSLCTPHVYDITAYVTKPLVEILVLVENTGYPTKGGHLTSPDTQSNWNGITGQMTLEVFPDVYADHVQAYPNPTEKNVTLTMQLHGASTASFTATGSVMEDDEEDSIPLSVSYTHLCLGRCLPVVLPAASGRIGAAGLARCLLGNRTAGRHGIGVRVTGHAGSVRCFRCRCGSAFRGICGAVRCAEIFRNICRIRCKGIRCVRHRRLSAGKPCPAVGTVLGALRHDLAAGFTSQHRVYLRN